MLSIGHIDLAPFLTLPYAQARDLLVSQLHSLYRSHYTPDQRITVSHSGDLYVKDRPRRGIVLGLLVQLLRETDITPSFVQLHTSNPQVDLELAQLSQGTYPMEIVRVTGDFQRVQLATAPYSRQEQYQYGSANPVRVDLDQLTPNHQHLLSSSSTFCMYPWIHIHAYPTGAVYPCCHAEMAPGQVGNARTHTLAEIFNSSGMRALRQDMLAGRANPTCGRCYEQEAAGFFSGRQSANKHHGHHIGRTDATQQDGGLDSMQLTYWDIRFSNLCNLKCRSCGHIFSSQWYQDQARLAGPGWKLANSVLNYAGRDPEDMFAQLRPHLDYVEQIYFAGGEPLLMEEHYRILAELVERKRFDVRLVYNTNFTHTDLRGQSVFDYWSQFESVSVGASLDASGAAAEYIRKGTLWPQVVQNRLAMQARCPDVDFYISPTLSILNAESLLTFHRAWAAQGLIRAEDLNINILQDPACYRIDIAPTAYKERLTDLYREHIKWLRAQGDSLGRATQGFESAVQFMNATDNSDLIPRFWEKTDQLDAIRNERCLDIIPELAALK